MKKFAFLFACMSLIAAGFVSCSESKTNDEPTPGPGTEKQAPTVVLTAGEATATSLTFTVKTTDAETVWAYFAEAADGQTQVDAATVMTDANKIAGTEAGKELSYSDLTPETAYIVSVVAQNTAGQTQQVLTAETTANGEAAVRTMTFTSGQIAFTGNTPGQATLLLFSESGGARFSLHFDAAADYPEGRFPLAATASGNYIDLGDDTYLGEVDAFNNETRYLLAAETETEPSYVELTTKDGLRYDLVFSVLNNDRTLRFNAEGTYQLIEPTVVNFNVTDKFSGADRVVAENDPENLYHLVFQPVSGSEDALELYLYTAGADFVSVATNFRVGSGTAAKTLGKESFVRIAGREYAFQSGALVVTPKSDGSCSFTFTDVKAGEGRETAVVSGAMLSLPLGNMSTYESETVTFGATDARFTFSTEYNGWAAEVADGDNSLALLIAATATDLPLEGVYYAAEGKSATLSSFLHMGEIDGARHTALTLGGKAVQLAAGRDSKVTLKQNADKSYEVAFALVGTLDGQTKCYQGTVTLGAEPITAIDASNAAMLGANLLNDEDTLAGYPADVLPVRFQDAQGSRLYLALHVEAGVTTELVPNGQSITYTTEAGGAPGTIYKEKSYYEHFDGKTVDYTMPIETGSVTISRNGSIYTFEYNGLSGQIDGKLGIVAGTWTGVVALEAVPEEIFTPENVRDMQIIEQSELSAETTTGLALGYKLQFYLMNREESRQEDGRKYYVQIAMNWDRNPLDGVWAFDGSVTDKNRFSIHPNVVGISSVTDHSGLNVGASSGRFYYSKESTMTFSTEDGVRYTVEFDLFCESSSGTLVRRIRGSYNGVIQNAFYGIYFDDSLGKILHTVREKQIEGAAANLYGIRLRFKTDDYTFRFHSDHGADIVPDNAEPKIFTLGPGTADGTLSETSGFFYREDIEGSDGELMPFKSGTIALSRKGTEYTIEVDLRYENPSTGIESRLIGTHTGPLLDKMPDIGGLN